MSLPVLTQITAVPGKEHLVRAELDKLIPVTRVETGCLQ